MKIRSALAVVVATFGTITLSAIPAAALDARCGMVVADRGATVTFAADLNCGSVPGITIAADDVTIDLGGHALEGVLSNPYGIRVAGPLKRPTIQNGTVVGFTHAISVQSAFELKLLDLRVKNTAKEAIIIADSAYMTLDRLVVHGAGDPLDPDFFQYSAINIDRSHDFTITNVTETNATGTGLHLVDTRDFTVADSSFVGNGASSLYVGFATARGVISRVEVAGSSSCLLVGQIPDPGPGVPSVSLDHVAAHDCGSAVDVSSTYNAAFDSLDVYDNTYGMIVNYDSVNTVVTNSLFHDNYATGFAVLGWAGHAPLGTVVTGNSSYDNGESGFYFRGAAVATSANTSTRNGESGYVWLEGAGGTSVNDIASTNGLGGFEVRTSGAVPLTVTSAQAIGNAGSGLLGAAGSVVVSGGGFSWNGRNGVEVTAGRAKLLHVTASRNAHSGVYFGPASFGGATAVTAVKNLYYGLAVARGSAFVDGGGHTLSRNGIADRCAGVCVA